MLVHYEEVYLRSTKSGKCSICNKTAKRSKKFSQTLNPWNIDDKGKVRTRDEIYKELRKDILEWQEKIVLHEKCRIEELKV